MIDIGNGHHINSSLVALVLKSSDPFAIGVRERAMKNEVLYDATGDDKDKSVVVLSTNQVVLSSLKSRKLSDLVRSKDIPF